MLFSGDGGEGHSLSRAHPTLLRKSGQRSFTSVAVVVLTVLQIRP